jgi:hypothetical protein
MARVELLGALAYVVSTEQLRELVTFAVELGGFCPVDEYVDEHEGWAFLLSPVTRVTDETTMVGVVPLPRVPKVARPGEVTARQWHVAALDGRRAMRALDTKRPLAFLEVANGTLRTLQRAPEPVKMDVARFIQREGLALLARTLESAGEVESARMVRAAM